MSGLLGLVAPERDALRPLGAMSAALRHRGGGDEGYLLADTGAGRTWWFRGEQTMPRHAGGRLPAQPPEGVDLVLAHHRGPGPGDEGPRTPVSSADGRLWLALDGDLEETADLRRALGAGAEVAPPDLVLLAYDRWGAPGLARLRGSFALALYDARERLLLCARDRLGARPLHYFWGEDLFAFASEVKALLRHPQVPRRPHPPSVHRFLTRDEVRDGDATAFEGIHRLPPGHHLALHLRGRRPVLELGGGDTPRHRATPPDTDLLGLLRAATVRAAEGEGVVLVSAGGAGSAVLAALLEQAGRKATALEPEPEAGPLRLEDVLSEGAELAARHDEPISAPGAWAEWRAFRRARERGARTVMAAAGCRDLFLARPRDAARLVAFLAGRRGLPGALRLAARLGRGGEPLLPLLLAAAQGALGPRLVPGATPALLPEALLEPAFAHRASGRSGGPRREPGEALPGADPAAPATRPPTPAGRLEERLRRADRSAAALGLRLVLPFAASAVFDLASAIPAADLRADGRPLFPVRALARSLGVTPGPAPGPEALPDGLLEAACGRLDSPRLSAILRPAATRKWLSGRPSPRRRLTVWRLLALDLWLERVVEAPRSARP